MLFPSLCVCCGDTTHQSQNICISCQASLPILSHCCIQCAQILPENTSYTKCGICLKNTQPFRQTYALFPYQTPIIQLIKGLKFNHQLCYGLALSELLIQNVLHKWYQNKPLPDQIIPVPLHPKRLQERGFNQALEIARPLADFIPIDFTGVKRIKNTQPQTYLSALERKKNMAHAFISTRDYSGLSIAIIDDVITTGQTILELCQILKKSGAAHIDVWCCARRV